MERFGVEGRAGAEGGFDVEGVAGVIAEGVWDGGETGYYSNFAECRDGESSPVLDRF
ncbi:MAG: hypothetical protein ACI9NQ_000556 [Paracoccaceae bacterium]|jgi:hypothetical protein